MIVISDKLTMKAFISLKLYIDSQFCSFILYLHLVPLDSTLSLLCGQMRNFKTYIPE